MIKAIIFDLSDVCFSAEEPPFIAAFAKRHSLPFEEFEQEYLRLLVLAENHQISGTELWRRMLKRYNLKLDIGDIIAEMIAGKEPYQDTLDFVKELRKNVKTTYFTNYNEDYWKLIAQKFDLSEYFDFGLVSYEIGARKPSARGFRYLLDKLGVKPEETVFTDDTARNLEEPAKLGIHTIQFRNVAQLRERLSKLACSL